MNVRRQDEASPRLAAGILAAALMLPFVLVVAATIITTARRAVMIAVALPAVTALVVVTAVIALRHLPPESAGLSPRRTGQARSQGRSCSSTSCSSSRWRCSASPFRPPTSRSQTLPILKARSQIQPAALLTARTDGPHQVRGLTGAASLRCRMAERRSSSLVRSSAVRATAPASPTGTRAVRPETGDRSRPARWQRCLDVDADRHSSGRRRPILTIGSGPTASLVSPNGTCPHRVRWASGSA